MAELTQSYLDQQLATTTETILNAVQAGFGQMDVRLREHDARFQKIEATLAELITTVDRFAKLFTDVNQEVAVLRQQLRDAEERINRLELKAHAA